MKIVIPSFLLTILVIAEIIGTRIEVKSSGLESKILNGKPAEVGVHRYMASLQLDEGHICSSGIFQVGFLLTTGDCAWYIGQGIEKDRKRATAVFTDSELESGQRVDIFKVAYYSTFRNNDHEFGLVMLASKVDYSRIEIMHLMQEKHDLRVDKSNGAVCGWSPISDCQNHIIVESKHSDKLQCISVHLYGFSVCLSVILDGDFRHKLFCGKTKTLDETTTLGDLGSPLTIFAKVNGTAKNCLIGITIRRFEGVQISMLRFIRVNYVYNNIKEVIQELQKPSV